MIDILFYWVYQILKGPERRNNVQYMLSIDVKMWAALNICKYRDSHNSGNIGTEFIEIGFVETMAKRPVTTVRSIIVKLNILSVDLEDPLMDISCLEDEVNRDMHEELRQITSNSDSSQDEGYVKMMDAFTPFIKEIRYMKVVVHDDYKAGRPADPTRPWDYPSMLKAMQAMPNPYVPMTPPPSSKLGSVVYSGGPGAPLAGIDMSGVLKAYIDSDVALDKSIRKDLEELQKPTSLTTFDRIKNIIKRGNV